MRAILISVDFHLIRSITTGERKKRNSYSEILCTNTRIDARADVCMGVERWHGSTTRQRLLATLKQRMIERGTRVATWIFFSCILECGVSVHRINSIIFCVDIFYLKCACTHTKLCMMFNVNKIQYFWGNGWIAIMLVYQNNRETRLESIRADIAFSFTCTILCCVLDFSSYILLFMASWKLWTTCCQALNAELRKSSVGDTLASTNPCWSVCCGVTSNNFQNGLHSRTSVRKVSSFNSSFKPTPNLLICNEYKFIWFESRTHPSWRNRQPLKLKHKHSNNWWICLKYELNWMAQYLIRIQIGQNISENGIHSNQTLHHRPDQVAIALINWINIWLDDNLVFGCALCMLNYPYLCLIYE